MVIDARNLLKPLLLLGLGGYFAWLVLSGSLKNYINTDFAWLSIVASVLFLLLGFASLGSAYAGRASHSEHEHDHDHEDVHEHDDHEHEHVGHGHSHASSWVAIGIVAVPLLIGILVPSKPLDGVALDRDLSFAGNTSSGTQLEAVDPRPVITDPTPVTTGPHQATPIGLGEGRATAVAQPEWTIYDWQQAFQSGDYELAWFDGQSADLVGMVVRPEDAPAGHFVVGRWVMRHCAADAFGVGMLVATDQAATLPEEEWVRVRGTLSVQQMNNEPVLIVRASNIDDKISEPSIPYIFPRRIEPKN